MEYSDLGHAFTENMKIMSADDNNSLKHIQRACRLIEIIHGAVNIPNSNKCIQLCTNSRIKTKKLANRKKTEPKKKHLNASRLELTSFECLNTRLSTRLSGNCE